MSGQTENGPEVGRASRAIRLWAGRNMPAGKIVAGERHRRDMGDLQPLADSIRKVGLLHPLVVTSEGRLVAGERRLCACRDVLGWPEIPVRILDVSSLLLAERDENEVRKELTPSERVALAEAIRAEIGDRQGQRTDRAPSAPTSGQMAGSPEAEAAPQAVAGDVAPAPGEETREVVARAAGFRSAQEYRRASKVVEQGTPELVQAMDEGRLSVSAAAEAADLPAEEQVTASQAEAPPAGRGKSSRHSPRAKKLTREAAILLAHRTLGQLKRALEVIDLDYEEELKHLYTLLPPKPRPAPKRRKVKTEGAGDGKQKITAEGGGPVRAKRAGQRTV